MAETIELPALGDIVFVRANSHAARQGISSPGILRPAIVTLVASGGGNWINCVVFNCQDGPSTFQCCSIPHMDFVNEGSSCKDYWVNSPEEEGE